MRRICFLIATRYARKKSYLGCFDQFMIKIHCLWWWNSVSGCFWPFFCQSFMFHVHVLFLSNNYGQKVMFLGFFKWHIRIAYIIWSEIWQICPESFLVVIFLGKVLFCLLWPVFGQNYIDCGEKIGILSVLAIIY